MKIFWGLLFVALDIRINSFDLLPDFIGYILIVMGLNLLASEHRWFRTARVLAITMVFVSIPTLFEMKISAEQAPRFKRESLSIITGDLKKLLPPNVGSSSLLSATSEQSVVNEKRTQNPERDKDMVLGTYSDGTVVLILRYPSLEEALRAMKDKEGADYSFDNFLKDSESKSGQYYVSSGRAGGNFALSSYSKVTFADRVIHLWWNRGWDLWQPSTWRDKGGWSSRILYIVEGSPGSADAYKTALEGEVGGSMTLDLLSPLSRFGDLLELIILASICSGIAALALASNDYALVRTATRRLSALIILTVVGWVQTWFIAPGPGWSSSNPPDGLKLLWLVGALLVAGVYILVMALMKRAADSL